MNRLLILFFFSFFLILLSLSHTPQVNALGIGQCYIADNFNNPNIHWAYPGVEVSWNALEPREGEYNFTNIDKIITNARASKKKVWIMIPVTNSVSPDTWPTVPQWTIDKGMHALNRGTPIQWDPLYLEYHEKLLKAFAAKYEKPEYYDVIEAIIMQAGGDFGEMTLKYKYCYGDPNKKEGEKDDALDPDNIYVKEMARVYLGSENRSNEIAQLKDGKLVFDDYFIKSVKKIIDIYGRTFSHYPFVLPNGFGLSCQPRVLREVADYGVGQYHNHMWLRTAGWGSWTGLGNGDPNEVDSFFLSYETRTAVNFEVGHPSYWCAAEDGFVKAGCMDCCQWDTHAQAVLHNTNAINIAINSGAESVCLYPEFFTNPKKYPIDMTILQTRLEGNYRPEILDITPLPTHLPTQTPIPTINYKQITKSTYYYYVLKSNSGQIPTLINLDFNYDGHVNTQDRLIIVDYLKQQ